MSKNHVALPSYRPERNRWRCRSEQCSKTYEPPPSDDVLNSDALYHPQYLGIQCVVARLDVVLLPDRRAVRAEPRSLQGLPLCLPHTVPDFS
eukprot:1387765-Pyramimonas_sp.AAC.1